MAHDAIYVVNARSHNLQGVSCQIPLRQLTVVSGPSGSGKSSLAFDTVYAEGQRRYVASLSTYARQFLERLPRPAVDAISNLPPAIAIEQRNPVVNARSTVGTATEIQDHLRLLFARAGTTRCCGGDVTEGSVESVTHRLLDAFGGTRGTLAALLPTLPSEASTALRERLLREGWRRILQADGQIVDAEALSGAAFGKAVRQDALLVVDRLAVRPAQRARIAEAVAAAFARGGLLVFSSADGDRFYFREGLVCDSCGRRHPSPEPALFSFNSPLGACPECQGFGRVPSLDLERLVPDPERSLAGKAIAPFATPGGKRFQRDLLRACRDAGVPTDRPWARLRVKQRRFVLEGDGGWYGVRGYFAWLESRRYKVQARVTLARYRRFDPCGACAGTRLRPEALEVFVGGHHLGNVSRLTLAELDAWLQDLRLEGAARQRAERLLGALRARVRTALRVGIGYLSLDRQMRSLSGGEAQRIQLATALGGTLTATLYVLDEPSVGLHARDVGRLLSVLRAIRDQGNTVVVVEHAPEILRAADHMIDLGPGSGQAGGQVVAEGSVAAVRRCPASQTGRVLAGCLQVRRKPRRDPRGEISLQGARAHNLAGLDVVFPLGQLVVVTGVSGAGKTTLVRSVLVGQLEHRPDRGACDRILGAEQIRQVVCVESRAGGRSQRSNAATVSKAFEGIRKAFAATPEARRRGLAAGWFSFNVPGGRCEACEGSGEMVVDLHFLEDLRIPCEECGGTRYGKEARELQLRGRSIVEVLALSVDEALAFFAENRAVSARLQPLQEVGLGYLSLSQPLSTLSGGELQRLRVAQGLGAGAPGVLYVLDEPTTGLHVAEVQQLVDCLDALLEAGGSVIVVEHNLDVIRVADHVIDLGPEGGPGGGHLVAAGTPEAIAAVAASYTGAALRGELGLG